MAILNLTGSTITPKVIAIIVTMLEKDGCVEVVNANTSSLPGEAAMTLGMMLERVASLEKK